MSSPPDVQLMNSRFSTRALPEISSAQRLRHQHLLLGNHRASKFAGSSDAASADTLSPLAMAGSRCEWYVAMLKMRCLILNLGSHADIRVIARGPFPCILPPCDVHKGRPIPV